MGTSVPSGTTPTVGRSAPLPRLALASSQGGGGNPILKVLLATVIVVLAIGAYVYFGEKPPVAVGEITHLTAYPIHRDSKGERAADPNAAKLENSFDEVIVIAEVRIHNQSQVPLFPMDMDGSLSLPGEEHHSLAAGTDNYNRLFVAYPELQQARRQPLVRDATIVPGETAEGQLVFNYPITKDQWDLRRSFDVIISFQHQKDLKLPAPQ
jgi:hypothetical protein